MFTAAIKNNITQLADFLIGGKSREELSKKTFPLPEKIGEYFFVKNLLEDKAPKLYDYGLYDNGNGVRGFAKQWTIGKSGMCRYWLLNEIRIHKILGEIYEKSDIQKVFPKIHTARMLGTVVNKDRVVILLEYIEGKNLSAYLEDKDEEIKLYSEVFAVLRYIEKNLTKSHKKNLVRRSNWYWITIFPLVFIRAIIRHPEEFKMIIKGSAFFWARIYHLIIDNRIYFSHRDVGVYNIIKNGDHIWIIDFQLAVLANRLLDPVTALFKVWHEPKRVQNLLSSKTYTKILHDKTSREIFKALITFFALYDLGSGIGYPTQKVAGFLKYATSLD